MSERIASLVTIAESGIRLEEITTRLRALEEEKMRLEENRKNLEAVKSGQKEIHRWAEVVADFFTNFESRFLAAPPAEQKVLLRELVERIIIDRERNVALVYIWLLPKGEVRGVDDLLAQKKKGGQIPDLLLAVPPTGFEPVYWA